MMKRKQATAKLEDKMVKLYLTTWECLLYQTLGKEKLLQLTPKTFPSETTETASKRAGSLIIIIAVSEQPLASDRSK